MESAQELIAQVGSRIRSLRQARGWSIEELGRRAGRHATFLSGIERGERNITIETVVLISNALEVAAAELIEPAHSLTSKWKCTSIEVLDAVASGFRAQVDVLGKLAELKLYTKLSEQTRRDALEWLDKDGEPDFRIKYKGTELTLQCKNVRSRDAVYADGSWKAELQKTRNSKDGTNTRAYRVADFDVLAVCTFNQSGEWAFVFAATRELETRDDNPSLLKTFQRVPRTPDAQVWHGRIEDAMTKALQARR